MPLTTKRRCPYCGHQIALPLIVEQVMRSATQRSVGDIKFLVRGKIDASDKEIYNALSYLTRNGRVRRLGYGQYVAVRRADDEQKA